jgi:hypothetical protein
MNGPAAGLASWPRRRWLGWTVLLTLAQAAAILILSDRSPLERRSSGTTPTLHALGPPGATGLVSELLSLEDPTLFALPHARGFAGLAWQGASAPEYAVAYWDEPNRWLSQDAAAMDRGFAAAREATTGSWYRVVARKPPPRLRLTAVDEVPLPTQSVLRVEGELARWFRVEEVTLPAIPHTNVLTHTEVQVGVDASGYVFSCIPLVSCGLRAVDAQALEFTRRLRLRPLDPTRTRVASRGAALTWGRLQFRWHTVPWVPEPLAKVGP